MAYNLGREMTSLRDCGTFKSADVKREFASQTFEQTAVEHSNFHASGVPTPNKKRGRLQACD